MSLLIILGVQWSLFLEFVLLGWVKARNIDQVIVEHVLHLLHPEGLLLAALSVACFGIIIGDWVTQSWHAHLQSWHIHH